MAPYLDCSIRELESRTPPHCPDPGTHRLSMLKLDLTRVGYFIGLFGLKMDYCRPYLRSKEGKSAVTAY
jgi:hypothetical protein